MKKMIGLAMLATTALAGTASAEVSANVAYTTDYVFRGISQSAGDAAVSGGFDWSNDSFYAGTWASSLGSGSEFDLYAGWTPSVGPVSFDLGVIGYYYPGSSDTPAELDYYEAAASASYSPIEPLTLGAGVYYSPDFYGEREEGIALEGTVSYAFSDALSVSGAYGNQSIDDLDGPGAGTVDGDYDYYNVGVSYSIYGFGLDLRYHDTDISTTDQVAIDFAGTDSALYEENIVFSISRAL